MEGGLKKLNAKKSEEEEKEIIEKKREMLEKLEIQRIKQKQKSDIKNILDEQIKQELIRKETIDKENKQKIKRGRIQSAVNWKAEIKRYS